MGDQNSPQNIVVPQNIETIRTAGSDLYRALDAELLDPEAKGAGMKFEDRGGPGRALDSPTGLTENFQNMVAFRGRQIL